MRALPVLMLSFAVTAAVAAPAQARQSPAGGFRITVKNWFSCATCTTIRGVVAGDVVGTLRGAVIALRPAGNGAAFQTLHDRLVVRAANGSRSFVALVNGRRNLATGTAALDGLVTDGWEKGAMVHVELRPTACLQSARGCYTGTIRVK
jgi:hypothetical protein